MPLGLYLHFPFCTNKCAYCDFYKELHNKQAESRYFESLKLETDLAFDQLGLDHPEIDSIYIGGGTPSLAGLDHLEDWLAQLRTKARISSDCEFSLECNPESVTREKFEGLQALGVTRPVIGIQSFDAKLLRRLDRKHKVEQSHQAVYLAGALGFKSFGVDLIFGLPGQTSRLLSADLDTLVDLDPPHVSYYQLTVEEGTPLSARIRAGKIRLPENELMLAMYSAGVERLEEAEIKRYEVSSFAREGEECQHNLKYWTGEDYLGLGPGAHSFISGERFAVVADIAEYNRALAEGHWPIEKDESARHERIEEAVLLGLRMTAGITNDDFVARFGVPLTDCLKQDQLNLFEESGHLELHDTGLRLTHEGMLVADEIIRRLLK